MKLSLNIYKGREVEKTYTADEFDIMFGTVEDVIKLIDVDSLSGKMDDAKFVTAVLKVVGGSLSEVKTLLKEVFPDVTDDELKRTKIKEIVPLLVDLVKYSFTEIMAISTGKK